ncbi:MAG: galactose-1-phosphate uridylyltransferase [Candidatus Aminicenantes bacterium]|nr:galactose-1-phosphate uridylyltransferase [Candidatus Aminicenantes bacterium]
MPSERNFLEPPGSANEIRFDETGGHWVLFAPGRTARPNDFKAQKAAAAPDCSRDSCPFCPGREGETPPEVASLRDNESVPDSPGWRIRVVPNKYPALNRPTAPLFSTAAEESGPSRAGLGIHEVVIDGPDHDRDWADLPVDHLGEVLALSRDRLRIIEKDPSIAYIQLFKNKGGEAGASLCHPHTQILALPVVPGQVAAEAAFMVRRGISAGACFACRFIADEEPGPRLVWAGREFVALAPFASRFSYETHILPRRHAASFSDISDGEIIPLARTMREVLRRLRVSAGDPSYHLVLRQAPVLRTGDENDQHVSRFVHWRFEILPVLGAVAGFEWGTGCFINPVLPEQAAASLRRS